MDNIDLLAQPFGFYAGVPAWVRTWCMFTWWLAVAYAGIFLLRWSLQDLVDRLTRWNLRRRTFILRGHHVEP